MPTSGNERVLPALSIRGPWWWFILHGAPQKDIENRNWRTNFRGDFLIHAAKGMTRTEFDDACQFAADCGVKQFPDFDTLHRGGIVGRATLANCVSVHDSPWFVGRFGFVLSRVMELPFAPCRGYPGFFYPEIL